MLVCFDSSIRYRVDEKGNTVNNILITSPRKTERHLLRLSGWLVGNSSTGQDTYKQLMTMDDKAHFETKDQTNALYLKRIVE